MAALHIIPGRSYLRNCMACLQYNYANKLYVLASPRSNHVWFKYIFVCSSDVRHTGYLTCSFFQVSDLASRGITSMTTLPMRSGPGFISQTPITMIVCIQCYLGRSEIIRVTRFNLTLWNAPWTMISKSSPPTLLQDPIKMVSHFKIQ